MNKPNKKALLCRLVAQSEINGSPCTQRQISEVLDISLGKTNQLITELTDEGYLDCSDKQYRLTQDGKDYLDQFKVDNAIILAAGFGSRFVPFTYETPKGLLKVKGTPMIERQIEQLKACGIEEIIVVVGYLKEKFDYLIDKYGVTLVFNPEFAEKNNFVSLYYALDYLKRSYILMADNWIEQSIFNSWEADSWFTCLYFDGETDEWVASEDNNGRITQLDIGGANGWAIVGPAFFSKEFSDAFKKLIVKHYETAGTDNDYWEHILRAHLDTLPPMFANKQSSENVYEFESFEELRRYDESYQKDSDNAIMQEIARTFDVSQDKIYGIEPLKAGATNFSFLFYVDGKGYVFRKPGIGTEKLINRKQEKAAYEATKELGITDEIVAFDAESGMKISRFYDDVHIVDSHNVDDLKVAAQLIRQVHEHRGFIEYDFDIERMINYYRSLAEEVNAIRFSDFDDVAKDMKTLLELKDRLGVEYILCHGDFAYTNVLILPDGSGKLIDWEYSGMADPIMDISMFTIYSSMNREEIERFMRLYIGGEPSRDEWCRLYLYVALGGFLWCIWAEYKQAGGQEFGEYPLIQYRYAKDFFAILRDEGYLDI